jgi:magnesium-protoporphyrin O-methyltransferase
MIKLSSSDPFGRSLSKPSLPSSEPSKKESLRQAQAERIEGTDTYSDQRDALQTYFDRTARDTWAQLTSDAPVSRIRATVRAGRDRMRAVLLGWLPADLRRARLLDAGCGTGAFAVEAARRGCAVTAIDVAAGLVQIARDRTPAFLGHGAIHWRSGDMLDPALGRFDHVVAMDSLIHYTAADIAAAVAALATRTQRSMLFTFAPSSPALTAMHRVGLLFPRGDRAPAIQPVREAELRDRLSALSGWRVARTERVTSGFYTSQALELVRE